MNNNRTVLKAVVAAVLVATSGFAGAGGNTTVQVTATVTPACKFTAASMTSIGLGSINPLTVAAAVSGTTDVTYQCSTGTIPTVSVVTGGTTLTDGTNTIAYTFSLGTADAGTGFSTAGTAKVVATASIALSAAQDAAAGSYSDTVTLLINN